jgi:hypothetical protein
VRWAPRESRVAGEQVRGGILIASWAESDPELVGLGQGKAMVSPEQSELRWGLPGSRRGQGEAEVPKRGLSGQVTQPFTNLDVGRGQGEGETREDHRVAPGACV